MLIFGLVPSYQPEVSYEIFMRALMNIDVATGIIPVTNNYSTFGPSSTWHIKNWIPSQPQPTCYILSTDTCTEEVYATVKEWETVVKDYIVVGKEEENELEMMQDERHPLVEKL
jgi:hypothetical protein